MSKYKILKELIEEWMDREEKIYEKAKASSGFHSYATGHSSGAIEAYQQVLNDIEELQLEAGLPERKT